MKELSNNKLIRFIPLFACLACIIWGTPYKVLKIFYDELSITKEAFGNNYNGQILTAVSIRFLIAGIIVLLFALFRKKQIIPSNIRHWLMLISLALVSTTISYIFFNIGNVNIASSINASIVGQAGIPIGLILACIVYKEEKLTWLKVIAFILGLVGLFASQLDPDNILKAPLSGFTWAGEGMMIIHGFTFAIGTMLGKKISTEIDSFVMTGWNLIIGSVFLLFAGFAMGGNITSMNWNLKAAGLLFFLAIASAIPFSIWYWCSSYMEISKLSLYKFLIPLSGCIIGICFGEQFTWTLLVALICISACIFLVSKSSKK